MASRYYPPGMRSAVKVVTAQATVVMRLGHMVTFLGRALAAVPWTLRHYRKEFLRILADVTWGNGSIVVGGGTAGVIIVLARRPERSWESKATTRCICWGWSRRPE